METISATDAKQKFGQILDAVQKGPVTIRRQNRDAAVVLSPETYQRLRKLQLDEFFRFCDRVGREAEAKGLTEEILAEILADD